ncbi:MAG: general secretion pathway protein GspB [Thermodesulfobacteriota bacterium]
MSYILDALKKSEQERKQGEIPGLNSLQAHPRPPRYSSPILIYLLAGILLLMTLTIGLWLFFRQPPAPTSPQATSEIMTEAVLPQTAQPQEIEAEALPIAQEVPPDKPIQPAIIAKPDTPTIADLTPEPEPSLGAVAPPSATAGDSGDNEQLRPDEQDSPAPAQPELITFANLPPDIRSALPELVIAAHYYSSKPSSRMASINGRIMRQGQSVADGLILEEIIREGVILSFHDYRFSLEVFNR